MLNDQRVNRKHPFVNDQFGPCWNPSIYLASFTIVSAKWKVKTTSGVVHSEVQYLQKVTSTKLALCDSLCKIGHCSRWAMQQVAWWSILIGHSESPLFHPSGWRMQSNVQSVACRPCTLDKVLRCVWPRTSVILSSWTCCQTHNLCLSEIG